MAAQPPAHWRWMAWVPSAARDVASLARFCPSSTLDETCMLASAISWSDAEFSSSLL